METRERLLLIAGHGGLAMSAGDSQAGDSRPKVESMLVMSGGEGYIDFRIG